MLKHGKPTHTDIQTPSTSAQFLQLLGLRPARILSTYFESSAQHPLVWLCPLGQEVGQTMSATGSSGGQFRE